MWPSTLVTYFHFICIFSIFSVVIAEAILLRPTMGKKELRLLAKVDGWYGLLSILLLASGFIRVYYFGKGPDYYFGNGIFLLKLGLFILIGLLSIYPSVQFFKLKKLNEDITDIPKYRLIKRMILAELMVLVFIPILAILMANGADF